MFKFPNIEKSFWISSIFSCTCGVCVRGANGGPSCSASAAACMASLCASSLRASLGQGKHTQYTHTAPARACIYGQTAQTLEDVVSGCGGAHAHYAEGKEIGWGKPERVSFPPLHCRVCMDIFDIKIMTRGKKYTRALSHVVIKQDFPSCDFRVPRMWPRKINKSNVINSGNHSQ